MSIFNVLLYTVGESVEKREQEQLTESEVPPPGDIIATYGRLIKGIVMGILMHFLHNVEESREKREQEEFPGPDQLEVLPQGEIMTASDGNLNGRIVMGILI